MQPDRIRPIAIALIRRPRDGAILAVYGEDPIGGRRFYRPPGGGLEFGERSRQAVRREIAEELGVDVEPQRLLQVTESIFTHRGQQGHEIVFVWECCFADPSLYAVDEFKVDENGVPMVAQWVHPEKLARQKIALYPETLVALL